MEKDKLIKELRSIAEEAMCLADEYSGGESETLAELEIKLEKLADYIESAGEV